MISIRTYKILLVLSLIALFLLVNLFEGGDKSIEQAFLEYQGGETTFEILEIVYLSPEDGFVFASASCGTLRIYFFSSQRELLNEVWKFRAHTTYPILEIAEFIELGYKRMDFFGDRFVPKRVDVLFLREDICIETLPAHITANLVKLGAEVNRINAGYSIWYNIN